jgi:phage/plasmid-associated DNA primase
MEKYLAVFYKESLNPYKALLESIPLEERVKISGDVDNIIQFCLSKPQLKNPVPPNFEMAQGHLKPIYERTYYVGDKLFNLLEVSFERDRFWDDYQEVYVEIMLLFGRDRNMSIKEIKRRKKVIEILEYFEELIPENPAWH